MTDDGLTAPCFSSSYAEARRRFLDACSAADVSVQSHVHPRAQGPSGEALSIDIARLGPVDAPKILFTVCGTHGVEAYAGSAAQIQWLSSPGPRHLPAGVAVLMIHGLNPWGWAHGSQLNEDICDLNRNFVDFGALPPPNPLHPRIARAIAIDKMSFTAVEEAVARLDALREEVGAQEFMDAIARGQYSESKCLKFGGTGAAWSNTVLRTVLQKELGHAEQLFSLDWHTGLGSWGEAFELCQSAAGSPAWHATVAAWGEAAVKRGQSSWATQASGNGKEVPTPKLSGVLPCAIQEAFPSLPVAGGVVEFGTWPLDTILGAAITDLWIQHFAATQGADVRRWRAQMRTWFAPRDAEWEHAVLKQSAVLFERSLDALALWHNDGTAGAHAA